jgi:hypothetical protein
VAVDVEAVPVVAAGVLVAALAPLWLLVVEVEVEVLLPHPAISAPQASSPPSHESLLRIMCPPMERAPTGGLY